MLKIAFLQIMSGETLEENRQRGICACREAKEKGADIALFPEMWNNGYNIPQDKEELEKLAVTSDGEFVSTFAELAKELDMAIATCNYPGGKPDCNGHSSLFDGVAYLPELWGSRNTCVFEAGEDAGGYIGELDLDMLRDYRSREVHGNAYRHPQKYGILIDEEIREPFIRSDYRK